jgi:hypothetical protein
MFSQVVKSLKLRYTQARASVAGPPEEVIESMMSMTLPELHKILLHALGKGHPLDVYCGALAAFTTSTVGRSASIRPLTLERVHLIDVGDEVPLLE